MKKKKNIIDSETSVPVAKIKRHKTPVANGLWLWDRTYSGAAIVGKGRNVAVLFSAWKVRA